MGSRSSSTPLANSRVKSPAAKRRGKAGKSPESAE
jgi:hypothetical protein